MIREDKSMLTPINRWKERIIFSVVWSFCSVALVVVTILLWGLFFDIPPVEVTQLNKSDAGEVCPGTIIPLHNDITITQPTILLMYVSVMDEGSNFNIPQTVRTLEPRLHPHTSRFEQIIPWTVPRLPPGDYVRTIAFRGHDPEQDPIFIFMSFKVREDC